MGALWRNGTLRSVEAEWVPELQAKPDPVLVHVGLGRWSDSSLMKE